MLFKNVIADEIRWSKDGLIPAIVQDFFSGRVLMLAYVNRESLAFMQKHGEACFWSRSRNSLWHKGATSGDIQKIKHLALDCDNDTLLILAEQTGGGACHTGNYSCFGDESGTFNILSSIFALIKNRAQNPQEKSYTNYLLSSGIDKICKKIGEESAEVILAAKNNDPQNLTEEISDLTYHLLVLMHECGISPREIAEELSAREKK
jgi:phosphoribosyl-ATP pyrophosphohydrolase/phosphoribosyl-AMP cyclohydrolase